MMLFSADVYLRMKARLSAFSLFSSPHLFFSRAHTLCSLAAHASTRGQAYKKAEWVFFNQPLNVVDFVVVALDWLMLIFKYGLASLAAQYNLTQIAGLAKSAKMLRMLRLLRLFRALRAARAMRALAKAQAGSLLGAVEQGNVAGVEKLAARDGHHRLFEPRDERRERRDAAPSRPRAAMPRCCVSRCATAVRAPRPARLGRRRNAAGAPRSRSTARRPRCC